jgi:tetratricopeptide (TPR) repeat protein
MNVKKYKQLGDELSKESRWQEAATAYRQAIEIKPKWSNLYYLIAQVLEKQGDLEEATANYQRAVELNATVFRHHKSLGDILAKQKRFAEAINTYQQAIKLQPENENINLLLTKLQKQDLDRDGEKQKSWQKEINACEKLLKQGLFSQAAMRMCGTQLDFGWGGLITGNPLAEYVSSVRGNPSWESGKNRVALLTSVRNEGVWLPEWIAYHLALGFDKIVIYANDCTDSSDNLLKELDRFNYIKYIENKLSESDRPQFKAYFDALNIDKVVVDYEWVMVLDADEFLVLHQDDNIHQFIRRFDDSIDAVAINWKIFGSSGHHSRTDDLVIQRFQQCSNYNNFRNGHIKSLARTKRILSFGVHIPIFAPGYNVFIYANQQPVNPCLGFDSYIDHSLASIHHYVIKSYEEFLIKSERGVGDKPVDSDKQIIRDNGFFQEHDLNDQINSDTLERLNSTLSILNCMFQTPDITSAYKLVLDWYDKRINYLIDQSQN